MRNTTQIKSTKRAKPTLRNNCFYGSDIATPFIRFLNSGEQVPAELTEGVANIRRSRDGAVRKLRIGKLNAFLIAHRFLFAPVIEDVTPSGAVRFGWCPVGQEHTHQMQANLVSMWLEVAQEGLLSKIKLCANPKCGKWFFAKFPHHTCCTLKCRDAAAKQDTDRRERRRAYERKYYQQHFSKKRRVNAK